MRMRSCLPIGRARAEARPLCPLLEPRFNLGSEELGPSFAPFLPWEVVIPAAPRSALKLVRLPGPAEREIADGNHMRRNIARLGVAAAIAKGVELLDVAAPEAG